MRQDGLVRPALQVIKVNLWAWVVLTDHADHRAMRRSAHGGQAVNRGCKGTPDYVSDTPETWARVALLLYTAYRTVNSIKHSDSPLSEEDTTRALSQALTEAVSGHPASSSLLVTPWPRQVRRRR